MPNIAGPFPPTPAFSLRSKQSPLDFDLDQAQEAGPSKPRLPLATNAHEQLPPAPPPHDDIVRADSMYTPQTSDTDTRFRTAKIDSSRRPHSTYPSTEDPVYHVQRKYTDPTPQNGGPYHALQEQPPSPMPSNSGNHQLDVDLDVYSQDYNELEDDMRQPTLSFVTTSTVDSTTSSPSIGEAYTYGTDRVVDGKPEHEPRIRMRTGRQNAYSSAESSMASGAFSYHAYSEYNGSQPPIPPLPADVGLGLNRNGYRVSANDETSTASYHATSPSSPYSGHQPWRSPVMTRDRSHSVSTSDETDSSESEERLSSAFAHSFGYLSETLPTRQPWQDESEVLAEPNALAMVDDGRGAILNRAKLEAMGGIHVLSAMSENELLRLPRFTHLLLSGVGPDILDALPALLDVLSTTLVVLDISDNDLTTLPMGLRHCNALEELNISHNPLRQLPTMLGDCMSLRMLVADGCMLSNLPVELAQLRTLHTLCVRSNRLVVLPAWLCLLAHLETLRIDNNPFAPQWQPIVAPILASTLRAGGHSRSPSVTSNYARPTSTQSNYRPITPGLNSGMSSLNASQSSVGGPSSSADSLGLGIQSSRNPAVQPLRTTKGLVKQAESPVPSRAPSRSTSNPNPQSEVLSERPPAMATRRVFSAAHYGTDESEAESGDKASKWGFLRKVSLSRLRTEKDRAAQLNASAAANLASMPTGPVISAPTLIGGVPKRPPLNTGWSTSAVPTRPRGESQSSVDHGMMASSLSAMSAQKMPINAFGTATSMRNKRRSFLPIDPSPPSLNVAIPSTSPFMAPQATLAEVEQPRRGSADDAMETLGDDDGHSLGHHTASTHHSHYTAQSDNMSINDSDGRYGRGLESIKSYLRDLYDLSLPPREPYGGFEVIDSAIGGSETLSPAAGDHSTLRDSVGDSTTTASTRHLTISTIPSRGVSMVSVGSERHSAYSSAGTSNVDSDIQKRYKDDRAKRSRVVREIYETEKTYVRGLEELVQIYVRPASLAANSSKGETVIPVAERKVVFGGVESILIFHRDNFLPALERVVKPLLDNGDDESGEASALVAHQVGEVFRTYIAYMKQYSTYINNFDNALSRMKSWVAHPSGSSSTPSPAKTSGSSAVGVAAVGASLIGSAVLPVGENVPHSGSHLTPAQRKRVKHFLKRAKDNPRHSQISLESYLLLPVQRVPRYKLLLDDLAMCTPPRESIGPNDALDDAIHEIATLASLMNEEKRESESRLRLLHWQQRITSRGPSPLVQPHRKLILDGALTLIRVVKKASAFVEIDMATQLRSADGESTITGSKAVIPVEFIKPEPMEKAIMLILCSDMLVLVQQRADQGWDGQVDLFSVLRMATVREPASVSASNDRVLRVVDNRVSLLEWQGDHS